MSWCPGVLVSCRLFHAGWIVRVGWDSALAVERGLRPGGGSATIGAGAHGEPSELGSILVGVGDYSVRVSRVGIWC